MINPIWCVLYFIPQAHIIFFYTQFLFGLRLQLHSLNLESLYTLNKLPVLGILLLLGLQNIIWICFLMWKVHDLSKEVVVAAITVKFLSNICVMITIYTVWIVTAFIFRVPGVRRLLWPLSVRWAVSLHHHKEGIAPIYVTIFVHEHIGLLLGFEILERFHHCICRGVSDFQVFHGQFLSAFHVEDITAGNDH